MAFFSIVVPVYNKQHDVKKTLDSVLLQTFTDFEIIVVNDGSTDNSENIILALNEPRLKYFKTENKGISAARNFAINKSQSTVIAFLDADDYWYPNHLETLHGLYLAFPEAGMFASRYELVHPNNTIQKIELTNIDENFNAVVKDVFAISLRYRPLWTSCIAVKLNVFTQTGMFDTLITRDAAGEDTDMWTRIALKYPIAYSGKVTAQYILGATNRVSKSQTLERSFAKLDKFKDEEKSNYSLSRFLNLYRASYALKYKMAGDTANYKFYYRQITPAGIALKTKLLLMLPAAFLRFMFNFKQLLKKKDIHFTIYD